MIVDRPLLGCYYMDFGPVVAGTTEHRSIVACNASCFPLSFSIDQTEASAQGFAAFISRASELPPGETVEIVVTCDSAATLVDCRRRLEASMLINVSGELHQSSPLYTPLTRCTDKAYLSPGYGPISLHLCIAFHLVSVHE